MPNVAIINKLQKEACFYIGTDGMEKQLTKKLVTEGKIKGYYEISAAKLQRKLTLKNFELPFVLLKSIKQSKAHLKEIAPDVVFSKGGYVGLPVVVAAKLLGVPTIVHESDMTMGLANKISALFAKEVLTTYPTYKKYNAVGCIVRDEILHGNRQKGLNTMCFDGRKPILLVMGGSLGAKALNDAVCANENLSQQFDIFVICGKNKKLNCNFVHQTEFVSNIADIFAATSVCLTRAGSNALAELTLANVPFVAVPLEKCSRGEQIKNAKWYAKNGCCLCVSENDLKDKLPLSIKTIYDNRDNLIRKQKLLADLYGTDKVVNCILKYENTIEAHAWLAKQR